MNSSPVVPFFDALRFWFKLGFISFGGPAGQIAIMHRELVERRRWITEERFLHALNFCMLLPGPEAQQLATYIGWSQHGIRGGVAAGVLFILPGFLLITALSVVYVEFHSLPLVDGLLFGLQAGVLAVVIEAVVRIGRRALRNRSSWLVAATAFVAIFALSAPFPAIVVAAAVFGYLVGRRNPSSQSVQIEAEVGTVIASRPLKTLLLYGALWAAPIVVLIATLGATHVLIEEGVFFSKMAVVTFGGAYAALAYVAQEAVAHYGWLSADAMLHGLALAETTPGPLILVLTFVGFLGAHANPAPFDPLLAGMLGAALTTWVTFVPCFLWVFLGAPYVERLRRQQALASALAMVTAAVVGVILNVSVWFAIQVLFRNDATREPFGRTLSSLNLASFDAGAAMISLAASAAILRFKAPTLVVLAVCAGAGVALKIL